MAAVRSYATQELKITALRKSLIGPKKDFMCSLFALEDDFETCLQLLHNKFGDYQGLLPSETQKIRDLVPAKYPDQENANILIMSRYIRWNKINQRRDNDFSEMSEIMMSKLQSQHQDIVINEKINTMSGFETFFKRISSLNQKKITANPRPPSKPAAAPGRAVTGPPGLPATGARMAGTSRSLNCDWCSQPGHGKFSCPQLKSFNSVSEARKKIREAGKCELCLNNYTQGHKCSETYFHKKSQKDVPRACSCGSKLNHAVCPHARQAGGGGGRAPQPGAGGAHQNPQPVVPQPGVAPLPSSAARAARVQQPRNNLIRFNGTIVGFSLTKCQWVNIVAPNGYKAPILILYDTGCESTQISATLSNYSWCQTPADFIVKTVGERYEKSGCGNFVIESIRHPDKRINIDALYNDLTQTDVSSLYVKIPESWQHNYGFEPIVSSPGGMGMILVGTELEAQLLDHFIMSKYSWLIQI